MPTVLYQNYQMSFGKVLKAITELPDYDVFLECLRRADLTEPLSVELVRFLYIKARHANVSPSPEVDRCWHHLLLLPQLYKKVCEMLLVGKGTITFEDAIIPHDPLGGDNQYARNRRYVSALALYPTFFPDGPLVPELWPAVYGEQQPAATSAVLKRHMEVSGAQADSALQKKKKSINDVSTIEKIITVRFIGLCGTEHFVTVTPSTTGETLYRFCATATGIALTNLRLTVSGVRVAFWDTVKKHELQDGDTIDVAVQQLGC
jgi:hypothetical protein